MKRQTYILAVFGVLSLVQGCGLLGSIEGESVDETQQQSVTTSGSPDNSTNNGEESNSKIAPNVSEVSPADGAASVETNVGVSATFSDAMDPSSMGCELFYISS